MAKDINGVEKKKRVMGPRVVKDKVVFLTFVGEVDMSTVKVYTSAEEVMDAMDANPSLKRTKVVIPVKRKPAAPTAA